MRLLPCVLFFASAAGLTLAQAPVVPKPGTKDADPVKAKDKPKGDKPAKLPPSPLDKVEGYKRHLVEGFTLMMSAEADEADGKDGETKPKDAIAAELQALRKLLPAKYVAVLQQMPVWIEWDEYEPLKSGREGRATVSFETSSPAALDQAKKNPRRAKCLIVHSLKALTAAHPPKTEGAPTLLLQAVAYWLLDQVLGADNAQLRLAYRQAMENRLYDRAQNVASNEAEFFAELTLAHFDQLPHYPKTRDELKLYDPASNAMLDGIWGAPKKPAKPPTTAPAKPKALADRNGSDKYDLSLTRAGVTWGTSIHGPEFKVDDAKESIVLLAAYGGDEWIILSKLERLHEELSPYGVRILAVPPASADVEATKKQLEEREIGYTGLEKATAPQKGGSAAAEKPGHAILFDAEGKCVFRGSGYEVAPHVRAAVAKKMLARAIPGEAPKALAPFAESFAQGALSMMDALPKIAPFITSSDAEVAVIAKALAAELMAPSLALLAEAQTSAKTDPMAAYVVAEKIAHRYKGTSAAAKAAALMEQLKGNPAVAPELKARAMAEPIRKLDAALMAQPNSFAALDDRFQKPNAAPIRQLVAMVAALKKKHPMAKATADAAKIAAKYSLAE